MKVAYQGEPGAYSERALRSLFPDADPLPCETVRLVFSRVTSREAGFGVVPLENSQAGSVNETYELLLSSAHEHAAHRGRGPGTGGPRIARGARRSARGDQACAFPLAGAGAMRGVPVVDAHRTGTRARHRRCRAHRGALLEELSLASRPLAELPELARAPHRESPSTAEAVDEAPARIAGRRRLARTCRTTSRTRRRDGARCRTDRRPRSR